MYNLKIIYIWFLKTLKRLSIHIKIINPSIKKQIINLTVIILDLKNTLILLSSCVFSPAVSAIIIQYIVSHEYLYDGRRVAVTSCSAPRVPVVRSLPGSCIRGVCCQRVIRKTIDHSCCPGSHSFDDVVEIPRDAATRAPQEFRQQRRLGT